MQDIREIELRDSGLNANTEICFKVRATTLSPRLHTEGFPLHPHRTSHKGNLYRGICSYKVRSIQLLSPTQPPYTRGKAQSQNNNNLYTRRIKAQSQTPISITSTQEGQVIGR